MKALNYLFCLVIFTCLMGSCKKHKDNPTPVPVNNRTTPVLPSIDKPFLGAYLNDNLLTVLADTHVVYSKFESVDSTDLESGTGDASMFGLIIFQSNIIGYYQNDFNFFLERSITGISKDTLSEPGFKALFKPGNYSYTDLNAQNGFDIRLRLNHSSTYLYTEYGSQQGSTFTIKEADFTTNDYGERVLRVIAEFNCKLYDDNGNFQKDLNHGIFRGYFKLKN